VPAEHCKGAGDLFVAIWPFSTLNKASKTALRDLLNNVASVCMYSNGKTFVCGATEEEPEDPEDDGGEGGDEDDEEVRRRQRRPGPARTTQRTRKPIPVRHDGPKGTPAETVRKCCHFETTGTLVRPYKEIKYGLNLTFTYEGQEIGLKVDFDLKFNTEAHGVVKDWLCPEVCQKDTTRGNVDLLITGTYKPSVSVPGFGFDAGVALSLDLRLGMGEFLNTCE
jgi:hypothetical protein